jgi:Sec-independent protein secretion pathway component TatC
MKGFVIRILLRLYPAKWRNEFGGELEDLLYREPLRFGGAMDVVLSALREQLRLSNHPAALMRPLALLLGGMAAVFVFSVMFSDPLWMLIGLPGAKALSQSGHPPMLIQDKPFEGLAIIRFALPLLVTAFVAYPLILYLARVKLSSTGTPPRKSLATAFVICSGGLFLLSGAGALVAWQHGVVLTLQGAEPVTRLTYPASISACFALFARSTLEFGILLQLPVLMVFILRMWSAKTALRDYARGTGKNEGLQITLSRLILAVGAFLCGIRAMGYWAILDLGGVRSGERSEIVSTVIRSALLFFVLSLASAWLQERKSGVRRIVMKTLYVTGVHGIAPMALFTLASSGAVLRMPGAAGLLVLFVCFVVGLRLSVPQEAH